MEETFSMIKPNAMNNIGAIINKFEENGLRVVAARMEHLDKKTCETFYEEHKARPFYGELVEFVTLAPVMLMVLRGENAVKKNRDIMGDTDPGKAANGTIRKLFGESIGKNAVHGSDSLTSAKREIDFFFN